jgi:hypothetical protein
VVANFEDCLRLLITLAPKDSTHPRHQFPGIERLWQIIISVSYPRAAPAPFSSEVRWVAVQFKSSNIRQRYDRRKRLPAAEKQSKQALKCPVMFRFLRGL